MRRTLVVGALLALVLQVALGVESLSSGAQSLPSVSLPSVHVPSATVPSVQTPAGPTPSVSTPPVSTPPLSTPSAGTPTVRTPSLGTPSVGVPAGAGSSGLTAPALPGAAAGTQSGSASQSNSSRPAGAATGARSASSRTSAGTRAGRGTATTRTATAQARLHDVVARLSGCLAALSPQAQRVLVLRAGIGSPASSGSAVARLLHLSPSAEGAVEHSALSALQAAGREGCGSGAGQAVLLTAPEGLVLLDGPAGRGQFARAAVLSGLARVAAFHEQRGSQQAHSGPSGLSFQNAAVGRLLSVSSGTAIWVLAAIMLFAALALLAATGRRLNEQRVAIAGVGAVGIASGGADAIATGGAVGMASATAAPETARADPVATPAVAVAEAASTASVAEPQSSTAPQPRNTQWPSAPVPGPAKAKPGWLRVHASEVALGVSVVAGAVFARGRGRRSGRRRR